MKKIYKIIILLLLAISLWLINLWWLAMFIVLIGALHILFTNSTKYLSWVCKNKWIRTVFFITGIVIFAIFLRVFLAEVYTIPSNSMEDTLVPGDYVLVSKLNYGPKLPNSPFQIPWINLFYYLMKDVDTDPGAAYWDYRRLSGFSTVDRNDIIVFQKPNKKEVTFIKRCIGLPGDRFQMINGEPVCNLEKVVSPLSVKHPYRIDYNDFQQTQKMLDSLDIDPLQPVLKDSSFCEVYLTEIEKQEILMAPYIDMIIIQTKEIGNGRYIFPRHKNFPWTVDSFGPVIIPAKGMTIPLDRKNFIFYRFILRQYENFDISRKGQKFYVDGKEVTEYTFQQNYYFMLGDHRNNSIDSRFWGFVPEENIIGKAACVLFSYGESGLNWNRTMNML